jgi:predicted alpha/beta-fold hydrolase
MFKSAWWLPNGHLQTLWPHLFRQKVNSIELNRERLELPDGDFLDLDWIGAGKGPIVLLLHGLEGSIESHYAKGMLRAIERKGWRGVFMSFRGCSGEVNRLARAYHSGDTTDLSLVIELLRAREPETALAAIGFSLGGNVLLKWLGETGAANPLMAATAVSVPFELAKSVKRISSGFSLVYQKHLLNCLQEKFYSKLEANTISMQSFADLPAIKTIYEFDDKITAPLHGFLSADDYYEKCSSRQFLHAIRTPTLLIQSRDDPFMPEDLLPERYELSPMITLELTEKGGHVGFVTGSAPWRAEYWLEQRIPDYLQAFI